MGLYYITGNASKFSNATAFLSQQQVNLRQQKLNLDEIQSDSAEAVAVRKARDAYAEINKPLFVNDASWHIPALGGFPGPYMRYVVDWFTVDDILNLMREKQDRTIILRDTIVYKDKNTEKAFTKDAVGTLLLKPTEGDGPFITRLITFSDDGKSLAQINANGFTDREMPLWTEFAEWLKRLKGNH